MITKFDSLFAGHVDMDNVGYGGTPVNDRRFRNEHLATVFEKTEAMAKLMDRLGYNGFWMAEHHFQREGNECIPNELMMALHLDAPTERLKIGCGFNIAPMWHPLRLAEDYAMADILTGGRIIFGLGRGYHTREVETFGAPLLDQAANRELFEEQIDIIFKAFNEESLLPQGQALHLAARGAVSRLRAEGADPGAAPAAAAGRVLAADPGRLARGRWSSWPSTASRAWSAAARPKAARCTRSCSPGRRRMPRWASTSSSASGWLRLPLLHRRQPRDRA